MKYSRLIAVSKQGVNPIKLTDVFALICICNALKDFLYHFNSQAYCRKVIFLILQYFEPYRSDTNLYAFDYKPTCWLLFIKFPEKNVFVTENQVLISLKYSFKAKIQVEIT